MGENIQILPWRSGHVPYELTHFVPRLGLAYRVNDRTVLHGGYGKYFTQLENDARASVQSRGADADPEALYDGRPDFAVNPFNGVVPTNRPGAGAALLLGAERRPASAVRSARRFRRPKPPADLQVIRLRGRAATDRRRDSPSRQLRLHRQAPRRSRLQHEPDYDPGGGRPTSISINRRAPVSGTGGSSTASSCQDGATITVWKRPHSQAFSPSTSTLAR